MKKHFLNTLDYPQSEILEIIEKAQAMKNKTFLPSLQGKVLGLKFFNPSMRTRVSMEVGMQKLGGIVVDIMPSPEKIFPLEFEDGAVMNGGTIDHIKDVARLLSRYCDIFAIRSSDLITTSAETAKVSSWEEVKKNKAITAFAKHATVPVINTESNTWHPCQGIGDMMTIKEKFPDPKGKKFVLTWSYHPKSLPMAVPNSQILAAVDLGMDVTVAYPEGWDLDPEIMDSIKERATLSGASLSFTNDQDAALQDADVIAVKSWGSLKNFGDPEKEKKAKEGLESWMYDGEKMKLAPNGYLLHCLPVRRNVEVADEALDSPNSLIIDEAENRMWAQMSLLHHLLADDQSIK